jgi:hypothetical protein
VQRETFTYAGGSRSLRLSDLDGQGRPEFSDLILLGIYPTCRSSNSVAVRDKNSGSATSCG